MKRVFILSLAMIFATSLFAQKAFNKNAKVGEMKQSTLMHQSAISNLEPTYVPGQAISNSPVSKGTAAESELLLTIYDLQSNTNVSNRVYRMDDGTMMFTATISDDEAHTNRGSGYNYYNGTSWNERVDLRNVESVRSGWPSIVPLGNGALLCSHSASAVQILTCNNRSNPTWENKGNLPSSNSFAWPRVGVTYDDAGNEYIHVIASNQDSDNGITILKYWRSTDGGTTWEGPSDLPGLSENDDRRFITDNATVITKGSTIIVLYVDYAASIVYARSDNNGASFTAHLIYEKVFEENFFYITQFVEGDTLQIWSPASGYGDLDNEGVLHVVLNTSLVQRDWETQEGYYSSYYGAGIDGVCYWNETMGQIPTDPSFVNNIGKGNMTVDSTFHMNKIYDNDILVNVGALGGSMYGAFEEGSDAWPIFANYSNDNLYSYKQSLGVSIFPVISVDDNGRIVIVYSSITKEGDMGGDENKYYRRIYARQYDPETAEWQEDATNITSDFTYGYSEVIFPTVPHGNLEGNYWNVFFQVDNTPGLLLNEDQSATENYYRHNTLLKVNDNIAINEVNDVATFEMYPNPTNSNVYITLENTANIEIFNTVGQLVKVINNAQGKVSVDVSSFANGIYLVNVRNANGVSSSQKLIVR